ncbi:MAG: M15 family metallopeptidase [Bacteroidales bacterium]|nr:M15 family metallopeptidase [Bacteroidales bacterium]
MNRIILITITALTLVLSNCKQKEANDESQAEKELSRAEIIENKLKKAYPNFIEKIENNHLIWTDSSTMVFDDMVSNKSFDSLLNYPDIEDQFHFIYPMDSDYLSVLSLNYDPGRIRNDAFLKKMYGSTEEEVKKNLVEIIWLPNSDSTKLQVTTINEVHTKLQNISNELETLPEELKKYVLKPAGTFKWRVISGTNRLSAHSFGIAIDINVNYSHYWKWDVDTNKKFKYQNKIPLQIVNIFEKHGFIWGGKWYHYDTMHFEYRPELIN